MLLIMPLLLLFRLIIFYVAPQHPHLFVELVVEIKIIEFSKAQLAVIVVQAFFGDPKYFSCILQIQSAIKIFMTMKMQISPFLHQLNHLPNSPLFAPPVPLILVTVLEVGVQAILIWMIGETSTIPDHNNSWL